MLNPRKRPNAAGIHIAEVFDTFPEIALLNTQEPMDVKGGVLDLTFATATMVERIRWCVDDTVTGDHYGIVITFMDAGPAQRPHHIPKWKTDKANWLAFQKGLACCLRDNEPHNNENVDVLEARLIQAINQAASQTIPKTRPWSRTNKDARYYNDEIKEVNHKSKEGKVVGMVPDFWPPDQFYRVVVRQATSHQAPKCMHHDPQSEAHRLALIRDKALEPDDLDAMFSLRELRNTYKTSSGSAPGSDGISHPIISHLGFARELAFLQLINKSWQTATLPQSWKQAIIVPIPKPKEPGKYRPISLLSCLGKTAEMVVNRL
ncbi:uncharacterized protein [Penaeus vannamei]|uniref:uncharacterized protein n=1 Tax=Penaeus vannamei TaxID=6689 RepID=UPI00387F4F46